MQPQDGLGGDVNTLADTVTNGRFRLYGDANSDGFVTAFDFTQFRTRFGSSVP